MGKHWNKNKKPGEENYGRSNEKNILGGCLNRNDCNGTVRTEHFCLRGF